jgi:hypothetical protein
MAVDDLEFTRPAMQELRGRQRHGEFGPTGTPRAGKTCGTSLNGEANAARLVW